MEYLIEGVAEFDEDDFNPCRKMVKVFADTVGEAVSSASEEIGNKVTREYGVRPTVRILVVFDEYGNQYAWVRNGKPAAGDTAHNSYGHTGESRDHIGGHWELVV